MEHKKHHLSHILKQKQPSGTSSLVLTAAALQDHWSRSFSLATNFGPKNVGLGPAAKAKQSLKVKSVIDTGRHKGQNKIQSDKEKEKEQKEYVLDAKRQTLTLAQKFGLVHAPKLLLSENEWQHVKTKSNERDDSRAPCVICQEDFGLQEQVLLSCTHVFHKACLQALERFTGRKTCPMCRHQQYQTRVIHEGARMHKHKCATKIQSLWRGYVVKSWYKRLRQTVPPNDPLLRKKFYEERLSAIVDRMIRSIDMNIGDFIREIDKNVHHSRAIFSQWDALHSEISPAQWEAIQLKAVQRGQAECPICLSELYLSQEHPGDLRLYETQDTTEEQNPSQGVRAAAGNNHGQKRELRKPTLENTTERCSSSVNNLGELPNLSQSGLRCARSTVLLSCTHVFHATCLKTLEDIAMMDMQNTCPVCRARYQKQILSL